MKEKATTMHEYNKLHQACPECGDNKFYSTCMAIYIGYIGDVIEEIRNPNKCSCMSCGWEGIIHDLVKREDKNE